MVHKTRLAPSPTGALHLGNARTFLVNWALARQRGWTIVLRIDDLDGPRVKPEAAAQAIDMLGWLGVDWDEGPYYQTQTLVHYRSALQRLAQAGEIYPCQCTRADLLAAQSAPHAGDHELRYAGRCRPARLQPRMLDAPKTKRCAWRLRVPDVWLEFNDHFAGHFRCNVQAAVGDFAVATKQGTPSYQMAVVIDDVRQGVDRVVRGDDLLSSTLRQQLLYQRLNLGPAPEYWHLPLVLGDDGRRLAKRHGDSRLVHYREQLVPPERIIGLLAEWCGIGPRQEITVQQFLTDFDLQHMPHAPVVFRTSDHNWLVR